MCMSTTLRHASESTLAKKLVFVALRDECKKSIAKRLHSTQVDSTYLGLFRKDCKSQKQRY